MATAHHQVVVVGGGAAGITTAALLKRQDKGRKLESVAIIDPSTVHYYQPAFTLVGAGCCTLAATRRDMGGLIPPDTQWINDAVATFEPDANALTLSSGDTVTYDYLVVCPGLTLNFAAIEGLAQTLGRNRVCSNYSPDTVNYTWQCVQSLEAGAKAFFTQPAMPIKCPGAPQKAVYLTADYLRRRGLRDSCEVHFLTQTPGIFGVPFYAKELLKVAAAHGVLLHYQHNLVAVDGAAQTATFEITGDGEARRETFAFDMLHVTPPQSAPTFLANSPLADAAGLVEVDQNSLQHTRYTNIFGLGDAASTPNSKTAAAVRKQAPVVAKNILSLINQGTLQSQSYDGYASCPLTTAYGKALMAEFVYGGKPTPTLPLDPRRERWLNWWIKTSFLPLMYWQYMLKGYERFPGHDTRYVDPDA